MLTTFLPCLVMAENTKIRSRIQMLIQTTIKILHPLSLVITLSDNFSQICL